MNWDNTSAKENMSGGYFLEVLFTSHDQEHAALFGVILSSLILGLPLSWNMLWHLKASVPSSSAHGKLNWQLFPNYI